MSAPGPPAGVEVPAAAGAPTALLNPIDRNQIALVYRVIPRAPQSYTLLRGRYATGINGHQPDLHVESGMVKAVRITDAWRGISVDSNNASLKRLFRPGKKYHYFGLPVDRFLDLDHRLQILADPARQTHYGISPSVDILVEDFDALLKQAEEMAQVADAKGEGEGDDDDDEPPPDHGSRYARALFAEAFDHTNEDLDRALCLYDFGCQYADRKKISNDANDFDSNPTSFKNLMTLRDRGYVSDAFRQQAKYLLNTDDPHGYVLLSQEAEELLAIPLLRVIQSFQVSWAFGLTMTDLKDALNVALDVEEDDESDEDDEPVQLDLHDVVRATEVDPQGFSSLVAFLQALPVYENEDEDDSLSCRAQAAMAIGPRVRSPPTAI